MPAGEPLRLVTLAEPDPVQPGGQLTYALTVINQSDGPLTGVRLRLRFPAGSFTGGCDLDGGSFVVGTNCAGGNEAEWVVGTLAAGAGVTVRPFVTILSQATAGTVLSSVVQATADGGHAASADVATVVDTTAPLQLRVTESADPVAPGDTLTYTLTFGNRGPGVVGATLRATLPPDTTFVEASAGGTLANGVITWDLLSTLTQGSSGTRSFTVTVNDLGAAEPGFRETLASLQDSGTPQKSVRAGAVTLIEPAPALALVASASPDPVQPGGQLTYALTVTNESGAPLTGVRLRLRFPEGSFSAGCGLDGGSFVVGTNCAGGNEAEWVVGTLAAGAGVTVRPFVTILSQATAATVLSSVVRATADGGQAASADVATVVDATAPLQLRVTESADPVAPGDSLTYTLTFGNRGPGVVGATLRATLPPDTTFVAASAGGTLADGVITWNLLSTLTQGSSGARSFTVTVNNLGAAEPGFRETLASLQDSGTPQMSVRAGAVTLIEPAPALALVGTATPDPVRPGGQLTYALTVTNESGGPLTGVRLRLRFPEGSFSAGCGLDGGSFVVGTNCAGGNEAEWVVGTLAAGAGVTVRPFVTILSQATAATVLSSVVRATADGGHAASADVATVVDATAPLQLQVTGSADPVAPGGSLTYTLTFGNRGPGVVGATLRATLPPDTTFVAASAGGTLADGVITWDLLSTLTQGTNGVRSFTVTVNNLGAAEPGFRETLASLQDSGTPQMSVRAGAVTLIEPAPALALVGTATPDPVRPGGQLTYALTLTNESGGPLTGVRLRLRFPEGSFSAGCGLDGGSFVVGTNCAGGNEAEWVVGTLAAGAGVTVRPFVTILSQATAATVLSSVVRATADGGHAASADVATVVTTAALQSRLTESADPVARGDAFTYGLTFGNRGPGVVAATHCPSLPPETTFVAADGSALPDGVITCDLPRGQQSSATPLCPHRI